MSWQSHQGYFVTDSRRKRLESGRGTCTKLNIATRKCFALFARDFIESCSSCRDATTLSVLRSTRGAPGPTLLCFMRSAVLQRVLKIISHPHRWEECWRSCANREKNENIYSGKRSSKRVLFSPPIIHCTAMSGSEIMLTSQHRCGCWYVTSLLTDVRCFFSHVLLCLILVHNSLQCQLVHPINGFTPCDGV